MLKISILCALGGMVLLLVGSFGDFQMTQNLESAQNKPCLFVQSSALNVRNMPNLESNIIGQLRQNSKICEYFDTHNGYLRTKEGWVAVKYLNLEPLKQNSTPTLSQTSTSHRQNSKSRIALTSTNVESRPNKSQNKSKFILTSTTKDSIPPLISYPSEQDFAQSPIQSPITQARAEMENQNYTRAKNLALRANLANPKNLESWEIFAKSLYLEGNPQEAILILQNFLQQNYDENLASLLKQMQQGHKI